jgi:hypothetical protein
MKTDEPTLKERAGRMYRQLLLLQRLFLSQQGADDAEWLGSGDRTENQALCAAVAEVIDELTEHARVASSVPFPLSEWRSGDGPDDDRWRALTEVERREVLSMVASYETLVRWAEDMARGPKAVEVNEYLVAERSRIERFRQELAFLDRRRAGVEHASDTPSTARIVSKRVV